MADKMMRMGGRSGKGRAKAIATNDEGNLITDDIKGVTVEEETVASGALGGYAFVSGHHTVATINVSSDGNVAWRVLGYINSSYTDLYIYDKEGNNLGYETSETGMFYVNITGMSRCRFRNVESTSNAVVNMGISSNGEIFRNSPKIDKETFIAIDIPNGIIATKTIDVSQYSKLSFRLDSDVEGAVLVDSKVGAGIWRPTLISNDEGYSGPIESVNKNSTYVLDVSSYKSIRIRTIGNVENLVVQANLTTTPYTNSGKREEKLMYGAMGFNRVTSEDEVIRGNWYCIKAITDIEISGHTRTDIEGLPENPSDSDTIMGLTISAGDVLYGSFTRIKLDIGECIAYKVNRE